MSANLPISPIQAALTKTFALEVPFVASILEAKKALGMTQIKLPSADEYATILPKNPQRIIAKLIPNMSCQIKTRKVVRYIFKAYKTINQFD